MLERKFIIELTNHHILKKATSVVSTIIRSKRGGGECTDDRIWRRRCRGLLFGLYFTLFG